MQQRWQSSHGAHRRESSAVRAKRFQRRWDASPSPPTSTSGIPLMSRFCVFGRLLPAAIAHLDVGLRRDHRGCLVMVCDECKEREAVCEFAYGNQPAGARKWNLCDSCLREFAPGFPSQKQIEEKSGAKKPLAP